MNNISLYLILLLPLVTLEVLALEASHSLAPNTSPNREKFLLNCSETKKIQINYNIFRQSKKQHCIPRIKSTIKVSFSLVE